MNSTSDSNRPSSVALPVVQSEPVVPSKESPFNKQYWMSVEEKLDGHGKLDYGEFPPGADQLDGVGRRDFVKLLSASMALAGVAGAGCARPPTEKIVPYHRNPEGLTVGVAQHYATAGSFGGYASSFLVTAREGRPVKIDGNPDHPYGLGVSSPAQQAELLRMYDPQRAKLFKNKGQVSAKKPFQDDVAKKVDAWSKKNGGASVRFLTGAWSSPLLESLKAQILAKLPNAKFVAHEALSQQNRHDGAQIAFGRRVDTIYDAAKARTIVSLDCDFLSATPEYFSLARGWAQGREPGADMNRLFVIETALTATGTLADHRVRIKGSKVELFARALAEKLGVVPGPGVSDEGQNVLDAIAQDLAVSGTRGLVVVGERQPPSVHALANAINAKIGAVGTTVGYVPAGLTDVDTGPASLRRLAEELNAGSVDAVVITAKNPVYLSYADVDMKAALSKADVTYLSLYEDESFPSNGWFVPQNHFLESWGDGKSFDGTTVLQQPLINPLYDGLSEAELLSYFAGNFDTKGPALLKNAWKAKPTFSEGDWDVWLRQGWAPVATETVTTTVNADAVASAPKGVRIGQYELALVRDDKVLDGSLANMSWLQELPHPVTKLVWDNAAYISQKSADALGVKTGDLLKLTVGGKSINAPVWVAPGHADLSITLALGYGRTAESEKVANGIGVNAYAVRTSENPWFVEVTVSQEPGSYKLVTTQEHWDMEKRDVALEADLAHLEHELPHHLARLKGVPPTLQDPVDYSRVDYKWGMAVDLNRCSGCSACMTACQAENNIPVVGKDGVYRNREMFWIRIDRYFSGDLAEPTAITQPVACQQCETAPCEYVCPVNATVHSDEGLNDMVYNRCIGTRYCSNNCPYKVRRFNYFHYTGEKTQVERLAMNPEVTVRARGVMEKCTWCVQRIESARIVTRRENRKIKDGEVKTACQVACPTQAISFGNLHDQNAVVSKKHADARSYNLLQELGTRPRNMYLARIRNPHPALKPAAAAADSKQPAHGGEH